jgi:hypothetical protein
MAVRRSPSRLPGLVVALSLALAARGAPQVQVTAPGMNVGSAQYGPVQPAEVQEIAGQMYLRRAVRTKGTLSPLDFQGRYYMLSDGGSSIVLIPAADFHGDIKTIMGRRVEVEGYVRRLVEHQGTCRLRGAAVPQSLCENPELPPTPDLFDESRDWPQVSITTWYLGDLTPTERKRGDGRELIGDLVNREGIATKPVRVAGRFCGAGLCGGLGAPPVAKAWVLFDDVTAVWVIGKEPAGKGWRLDPAYRADTTRWLEVTGRVEPCGTTRCLRAKSVALIPRQGTNESETPR